MNVASNTAVNLLLFIQDRAELMPDYSNAFIKEKKVAGEWEEIE